MATTYLHQIIALTQGADGDAKRQTGEIQRILAVGGDQNPLTGLTRSHEPRTEADVQQPTQTRLVQITTADLLAHASKSLARLFDLQYTREYANTQARGTVTLDGETFLEDVPAGYLLYLENQLGALISGIIDKLQALDPAEDWHDSATDPGLGRGVWAAAPRETLSTTKKWQVQKLAPATKEHAEQVRPYETDVVTGTWTVTKRSGQLPLAVIQDVRERATRLRDAVRLAREQANRAETEDKQAGDKVLRHVFGDLIA
jgi:hypothetical protein